MGEGDREAVEGALGSRRPSLAPDVENPACLPGDRGAHLMQSVGGYTFGHDPLMPLR